MALVMAFFALAPSLEAGSKPLWPGARYSNNDRDQAIGRGLQFINRVASNPKYFSLWGDDLLFCFYTISSTARNKKLREMARSIGEERARQWCSERTEVPLESVNDFVRFVHGTDVADKLLGESDEELWPRLREMAQHFSAADFLQFDPQSEPPPADIPESCPKCAHQNPRGATKCEKCQAPLTFRSRYDIWTDALIRTYYGDTCGVKLGAPYRDVLQWIAKMHPYPSPPASEDEFDDVSYAVAHVVYTLNDYHKYRLSRKWLPQEFSYLKNNINEAERYEDGEILGEFMDTLRAFGVGETVPEIRRGMEYLLSQQNPDGSWGDLDEPDIYTRYHSTWTAIDGLRQYSYHGEKLRIQSLLPLLKGMRVPPPPTSNQSIRQREKIGGQSKTRRPGGPAPPKPIAALPT